MAAAEQSTTASGPMSAERLARLLTALVFKLGPDAELPTIREIAEDTGDGCSISTVQRALEILEDLGFIVNRQHRGRYVTKTLNDIRIRPAVARLRSVVDELRACGYTERDISRAWKDAMQ